MNNKESMKQLSLDLYALRGIAIFLVVVGHVIGSEADNGIMQLYKFGVPALQEISKFIYTFHVPLFFIASGITYAGFSSKETNWPKFLSSRLQRLVVPLIVWAPIIVIFRSLSKGDDISINEMLLAIFLPQPGTLIFWFFHALLFASILAALFLSKISSRLAYLLFSASLYIVFWSLALFVTSPLLTMFVQFFLYWNLFYAFGIASAEYFLSNRLQLKSTSSLLMIGLCLGWMLVINSLLPRESLWLARLLNAIPAFIALYSMIRIARLPLFQRVTEYLGRKSMVIYLFHIYFGTCARILLSKAGIIEPLPQLMIGCIIALVGPILLYEGIFSRFWPFAFLIGETIPNHQHTNGKSTYSKPLT